MTNQLQNVAARIWRYGLPLIMAATPLVGSGARVSTDWFSRAGYGVCVHYLADGEISVMRADDIHSDGVRRDWNTCVDAFNVERFADEMKRAGAGYVVFTLTLDVCQACTFRRASRRSFRIFSDCARV